jgi:two-component system cell cycle response regulator DivK
MCDATSGTAAAMVGDERPRRNHKSDMPQKTILVVEDDKDHLTIASALLRYYGYNVLEAMNANDGIKLALERMPNLILMDLQLPEMNGIEALKVLRSDPRTSRIPAVPYTSFYDLYREQLFNLGFNMHIPKTFTPGSLQRAVVELIGEPNSEATKPAPAKDSVRT